MNHQRKISMKTVVRYIRDFSIVVAGIAVTLYVNDQVSNNSEKRDLKLYLNAVKLELEENIRYLEERKEQLTREFEYADYLRTHEKDHLNWDIIESYARGGYADVDFVNFQTASFEMFKSSGTMRLMLNKEMMLQIWKTYLKLQREEQALGTLTQLKVEEIKKWLDEKEKNPYIIPLYNYYKNDLAQRQLDVYEETSQILKEVVLVLEKELKN